jgi:hypothetical protein
VRVRPSDKAGTVHHIPSKVPVDAAALIAPLGRPLDCAWIKDHLGFGSPAFKPSKNSSSFA